jgi:hypothetical protein
MPSISLDSPKIHRELAAWFVEHPGLRAVVYIQPDRELECVGATRDSGPGIMPLGDFNLRPLPDPALVARNRLLEKRLEAELLRLLGPERRPTWLPDCGAFLVEASCGEAGQIARLEDVRSLDLSANQNKPTRHRI